MCATRYRCYINDRRNEQVGSEPPGAGKGDLKWMKWSDKRNGLVVPDEVKKQARSGFGQQLRGWKIPATVLGIETDDTDEAPDAKPTAF